MSPTRPSRSPAARPVDRRLRRNRAAILEAAIGLFQEQGLHATKLDEICERADVAPRTFFNHFKTRHHLLEAIARQRAAEAAAVMEAIGAGPGSLAERLHTLLAATGTYLAARPAYREMVNEIFHLPLEGGSEGIRSGVLGRAARGFVEEGMKRGEITRRHRPEVLGDILLGTMNTAILNWAAGGDYDLVQGLEQAADALLDLLTPTREEAGAERD